MHPPSTDFARSLLSLLTLALLLTVCPKDGSQPSTKSKRRRRLSTTDDQPAKDRIFFFVDSNSSSREKRAYVMRHHVQEKRRQRKHLHSHNSDDRRNNRPLRYLPWKQKTNGKDNLDGTDAVGGTESETVSHSNALVRGYHLELIERIVRDIQCSHSRNSLHDMCIGLCKLKRGR